MYIPGRLIRGGMRRLCGCARDYKPAFATLLLPPPSPLYASDIDPGQTKPVDDPQRRHTGATAPPIIRHIRL